MGEPLLCPYTKVFNNSRRCLSSRLACDCVKIARKKNYTYIGLQHYGECWGGKNLTSNYARDGPSKNCVNGKYTACKKGQFCMGKEKANYVYRIGEQAVWFCCTTILLLDEKIFRK